MIATAVDRCRACHSDRIPEVLNLGDFALSDFPTEHGHTPTAPLVWVRCEDCTLVQLRHTVQRDLMYQRYFYRSGTNEQMVEALADVVRDAQSRVSLEPGDLVLDIGANDGTMLRMFPEYVTKVAYEPADTFKPDLMRDIKHAGRYFPDVIAGQPVRLSQKAKVITSIAMFYDVGDPNLFVREIKANLHPDGVWINQLAYLPETLRTNNFGDICHEHLTYWTAEAFSALANQHGLTVVWAEANGVNGGSMRFVVKHTGSLLYATPADGIGPAEIQSFASAIYVNRKNVLLGLNAAKSSGRLVLGYGASTKGNTYLQYWGVGPDLLPAIADRNPDKWGTFTPTGIPIISEEEARARNPDAFLALPWHFLDSFLARESAFLERGGQFIVPFPELRYVGRDTLAAAA